MLDLRRWRWTGAVAAAGVALVGLDVAIAAARAVSSPGTRVVERGTGRPVMERRPFGEDVRIVLVWTTVTGTVVLCRTRWFRRLLERLTVASGIEMDRPASPDEIDDFIAVYGLDTGEIDGDPHAFSTLNDLFARPLRPGARPIDTADDPAVAVSPADCRLTCAVGAGAGADLLVKGRRYDVAALLGARIRRFHEDGRDDGFDVAVCRLAPSDYHRVHWPVDGTWRRPDVLDIPGDYHSVAAPCVGGRVDVLGRNRRSVSIVETEAFGPVAVVVVGAVKVGSIVLTASSGTVRKGEEMAQFRYGGSTVVLVFRRGAVDFDQELVENTAHGRETLVRMGSRLGRARSGSCP